MNNAPYEKTIENLAGRTDIRLLNDMEKSRRFTDKPHFVTSAYLIARWRRWRRN